MVEDADERGGDPLTTAEAFGLVENEVRQEILLALSDVDARGLNAPTLSFSELYSRVDADVSTSHFNYHLQQLQGRFVEQRGGDTAYPGGEFDWPDGYALRPEGLMLVWTLRSATTDGEATLDRFETDFDCYHCGGRVEATYTNAIFLIECAECGYHYEFNPTPPGVVHGSPDPATVLERVAAYNRTVRSGVARKVCPRCANGLDHRFVDAADTNYPRRDVRETFVHVSCDHCGFLDYLTVGELLLHDPAVVEFCLRHGVDVLAERHWDLEFVTTDAAVTVANRDPWRVRFAPTLDGETLEVVLEESLSTDFEP